MKRILLVFALMISVWLIYGCGSKQENPSETKKADVKLVKVQPVQTRKLVEKLQLTGNLRAENVANILATVEGKISKLLVREGDRVQLNTVVAMISSLVREDIINSARLLVQAKQEELAKNPSNIQLQKELEQARQDYQFAQQQYKEIPVTSPIQGVVSQRWVDLGDMVPAKAKLFEIQSSSKLLVDVPVSEIDIRKLKIGQSAEIRADACPEKVFKGVIQRIYPQVEPKTRNGMVEMRIADPCPNLKAGMFVRTTFVIRTIDNAIAIPIPAVIERPQKKVCFVADEGKAKEVVIKTGLETEGWIQILEGLAPGDKLIVEGQEQLKAENPLKIQGAEKKADQPAGGKR
ncbi:MAG: efflux RND transporter periplasmic adaptor subunit [candidate division KSB1 bacterium]|nr:efflux RND transporter periplasmic adaptor subunit [candidate division KSB1 bacterium]MDZ7402398.1 efflux RND transporter periplasmic adaptor subunit [candidate division KSB1 bacterium]